MVPHLRRGQEEPDKVTLERVVRDDAGDRNYVMCVSAS